MFDFMVEDMVIEADDRTWEKSVEKSNKPVAVMFYSPTCAFCKAMEPYFKQYAEEFKNKVSFVKINVFDNQFIGARYGVMGTPTFKFFCNGKPISELVGQVYPPLLKKTLDDIIEHGSDCAKNSSKIDYTISGYA